MSRQVAKGEDGFWRVQGQGDEVYYASEATARRVGKQLDAADAEKAAAEAAKHPRPAPAPAPAPAKPATLPTK